MSTASPPAATSNPGPLASDPPHRRQREHPSGFYVLCAVELFERFAGTLLGSLLLLYLSERLGMAAGAATRLGGTFNAAIYVSSVIGGFIADRWLGTRRSILLGALLLALGYAVLSMDRATLLYPAAGLLMMGHALFKPSISSVVGKLYPRNDPRRDDAYSLFYVVFNIGSGCGPVAGGFLRSHLGWSAAFAVAGLAMLAALAVGLFCFRYLVETAGPNTDAQTSPSKDRNRATWPIAALLGVLGSGLLFTSVYEQSGQSLLLWARDCTRHSLLGYSVPPSSLLGLPGLLVLGTQPLLSRTQSALSRRGHRPSPLVRIGIGLVFGVVAYLIMVIAALRQERSQALVTPAWLVTCFTALTVAELLVYPLGMSLVTRLAPQTSTAVAMALWLVSLAGGHWLAGEVASHWAMWSHATLFAVLAALALAAVVVLALASRPIRRALADDEHAAKD